MNLVAKEFVAAQNPDDPGVLILSNMAGAARELTDALLVNPYDTKGIAHAIQSALVMPLTERRARHERLLAVLHENDIHRWHMRFLEQLDSRIIDIVRCAKRRLRFRIAPEGRSMPEAPDPVLLSDMDAYWRAANYLSVGQMYLLANPLLREPLKPEHVKPRVREIGVRRRYRISFMCI